MTDINTKQQSQLEHSASTKYFASTKKYTLPEDYVLSEKKLITRLCSYVGSFFILFFATTAFMHGNNLHAIALLILASLFIINLLTFKTCNNLTVHIRILTVLMVSLLIFLFHTGGINGSGILWFYIYPPSVYFLMGTKSGSMALFFLAVATTVYLLLMGIPGYFQLLPEEFSQRLIASLCALSLLSFF